MAGNPETTRVVEESGLVRIQCGTEWEYVFGKGPGFVLVPLVVKVTPDTLADAPSGAIVDLGPGTYNYVVPE